MAKKILVFMWGSTLVMLTPHPIQFESRDMNIVWNIGQGQWFTQKTSDRCTHFDAGGERTQLPSVVKACAHLPNVLFLSHWDFDHLNFVGSMARRLPHICLVNQPPGVGSLRKQRMLKSISLCQSPNDFLILDRPTNNYVSPAGKKQKRGRANDFSQVAIRQNWLIPGDSPTKNEKRWIDKMPGKNIRYLLLGHHGSRTSTSEKLLLSLPNLKVAVASSRFARYGHPHLEVRRRLNDAHVPLLLTEDWGSIGFSE